MVTRPSAFHSFLAILLWISLVFAADPACTSGPLASQVTSALADPVASSYCTSKFPPQTQTSVSTAPEVTVTAPVVTISGGPIIQTITATLFITTFEPVTETVTQPTTVSETSTSTVSSGTTSTCTTQPIPRARRRSVCHPKTTTKPGNPYPTHAPTGSFPAGYDPAVVTAICSCLVTSVTVTVTVTPTTSFTPTLVIDPLPTTTTVTITSNTIVQNPDSTITVTLMPQTTSTTTVTTTVPAVTVTTGPCGT